MGIADLLGKIWKPEVFQGRGKKKDYFEGWYFKSVSQDEKIAYAIIVGVSITKKANQSNAFVMFLDARNQDLHYFKYPLSSFWANKEKFEIKIANNFFSLNEVLLDLEDGQTKITAKMKFENIVPWPVTKLSPGYGYLCLHPVYGMLSWGFKFQPFNQGICHHKL